MNYLHQDLTEEIIHVFYKVYNTLGYGFLEKVYEKAMLIELKAAGLEAINQYPVNVFYEEEIVGEYFADIMIENKVIVELKAKEKLCSDHEVQLVNYLKGTELEVGLLMNFGKEPKIKRRIFTNDRK